MSALSSSSGAGFNQQLCKYCQIEHNRSINPKWEMFVLCHHCIQCAILLSIIMTVQRVLAVSRTLWPHQMATANGTEIRTYLVLLL
jgi:hypothetical protein